MNTENNMEVILDKRKNSHDDYGIQKSWNEIIEVLSENRKNTIRYLENCKLVSNLINTLFSKKGHV
ncbi:MULTISPECIES: hypothetical protein [Bacillus]|uniref:hypothetical protein n=1 Tax=Bacillus TaxID=1386 RepID=UPI0009941877|nr:hypothetical protein [Bacillus mycoides]MED1286173.1 hypothetical protein [Bacillus mycoides]OOQ99880.1 hypothetical protein BW899_14895 [Bacillus mycoides]HDR7586554.1 hypothetical protein [Bacillus mycoides]